MTTPLRRRLRWARRGSWYVVALLLVAMALIAGVTSQLLPLAERHPERISAWLSARAGRTVAFDRVESAWTRRGPLLRVSGLRVGDGARAVPIGEAEILISQYAGLLPGRSFTELRLRNLALTVERGNDGRWSVRGLPGQQQPGSDPLGALEGLGELQVIAARLAIVAPSLQLDTTIPKVDVRLRVDGDRVRVGAQAWMQADRSPLAVAMDFSRQQGNGRLYAGAREADLAVWSSLLQVGGITAERGSGRVAAWAELRDHRVTVVTFEAALDALRLRGVPVRGTPQGHAPVRAAGGVMALPHASFARVDVQARWRAVRGGWRIDAPRLRVVSDGAAEQSLDGLLLAGGRRYGVLAKRIDAGPLFAIAGLSDRVAPGLRNWLGAAAPAAVLRDVEVVGERGGDLRATARVQTLGFAAVGKTPGLRGLSGRVSGDGSAFAFEFDPQARLRFDWPTGFGAPHDVALRGTVSAWRDARGWRVATPALRVAGLDYGADLRGGLWFQGDGTRPVIDLAARLDDTAITTARKFWVHQSMSPALIRWLDSALVSGRLEGGRAVVSGDLDDWPFRNHDGLFQANAHIAATVLKFNPEWPATDRMDGEVSFIGSGFGVAGSAVLAGVDIPRFSGGVADFAVADLRLRAEVDSDAAQMLALLRRSPLQKLHGKAMANLAASGPATATFALDRSLRPNPPPPTISGEVALRGAKLSDAGWKLAFGDVRGTLRYDRLGFDANDLVAVQEGRPGKLSLRAGVGHVRDRRQAFEAELLAVLAASDLLDRAPRLAWLKPRIVGRSPWTIAVSIPAQAGRSGAPAPSRLQLRSTLVGTTLDLPAPLDKPAGTPLATSIDTVLPFGEGDITVAFGELLALRARSTGAQTGVRVVLGSQRVSEPPPTSGLVAGGRADSLDALGWATLARGGSGGAALPLRQVDVTAGRLLLLGSAFPETRVRATPAPAGVAVQLDGTALAGALILADGDGAAVAGRLQRLYWRSAKPRETAATGASRGSAPARPDDMDPAKIPPLNLLVDDLRFGDARVGSAALRTRKLAGGMRIEQLQTRAPRQRIDMTGDWTGPPGSARTRLDAVITSEDFGELLTGFGFGARLDGGKGEARFNASWPGSPASFNVGAVQGSLSILAEDGRLVEIEPGAGRVLGLLSIAEIPRRLTLDFRDFFDKGFAFNRIAGNVRFGAGQARSDDLVINGPAAEISIRGAANLRTQTFDQTIEVVPRTGNLLTAVGAIAGGPVGAAVGAMANAVLRKPLGQMSAKTYRVTGPWKDPKVEVMGREQGRAELRRAPPAG